VEDIGGQIQGTLHFSPLAALETDVRLQTQDASYTYGCLEPTMLTQMAKYLDTVYVSGWQSSSTASSSDEPGPDLADYPYVSLQYSLQKFG